MKSLQPPAALPVLEPPAHILFRLYYCMLEVHLLLGSVILVFEAARFHDRSSLHRPAGRHPTNFEQDRGAGRCL